MTVPFVHSTKIVIVVKLNGSKTKIKEDKKQHEKSLEYVCLNGSSNWRDFEAVDETDERGIIYQNVTKNDH